jgi:4-amino-4-deoxy-L-arabinose transferase-like glycosyltransferase
MASAYEHPPIADRARPGPRPVSARPLVAALSSTGREWPLLLALAVLAGTTVVLLVLALARNGGRFTYALDDTYIHMAIAKNLVRHGVWGVTPYGFSSSSSAPLWTLLLALFYRLSGVREITPFLLNLLFAGLVVGITYGALHERLPRPLIFLALLAMTLFPPLVPVAFTGMEHTAELFLTLLTVILAASALSEDAPSPRARGWLLACAALTVAVRYEGLFLVLVLAFLFAARKRRRFALALVASGLFPVALYGLVSVAMGWYIVPNSVLVKGTRQDQVVIDFFRDLLPGRHGLTWQAIEELLPSLFFVKLNAQRHISFLVMASLLWLTYRGRFWSRASTVNAAFVGTALLHVQFANATSFYRYEAYVVGFGVFALALAIADSPPWRQGGPGWGDRAFRLGASLLLLILVSAPLRTRAVRSLAQTPQASHNIFDQQVQMAAFLGSFYRGQVVAANDIGAIDFGTDLRLVDLAGLATREPAAYALRRSFGADQVAAVADEYHAQIAVVYDSWFEIPSRWRKAGEWQIRDNVVCGDSVVSFYAVDPAVLVDLRTNLQAFSHRLPRDVVQRGY